MPSSEHSPSDGRTARRNDNRDAALRCVVALFTARRLVPTIEMVAEDSGVSIRSLYRYFGDAQTMITEAIDHLVGQARDIGKIDNMGEGPLADRITALVAGRFRAYHLVRPVLRAAVVNIANNPELDASHQRTRALLTTQFTIQFAPELNRLDEVEKEQTIHAGGAVCNLEFIDMLADRLLMSEDDAQVLVMRLMLAILTPR